MKATVISNPTKGIKYIRVFLSLNESAVKVKAVSVKSIHFGQ